MNYASEICMNNQPLAANSKRLLSMGTSYAIGTFNDNFFKQAALLLAATAHLEWLQGVATTLFAVPFICCSAWAGWVADRYPKRTTIIGAKYLELVAMLLGLAALCSTNTTLHWYGIVTVVFLMGLQSTFFSPALNGAIPENFEPHHVPRVNALLKLATTSTILLGIAGAGLVLDLPALPFMGAKSAQNPAMPGGLYIGIIACLLSVVGIATAYGIGKSAPVVGHSTPFPWLGPVNSFQHVQELFRGDKLLFLAIIAEAFFYLCSTFVVLSLNNLGVVQLGYSFTITSLLSVALMVGVCIGSLVAARMPVENWTSIAPKACAGMGAGLLLGGATPLLPPAGQLPLLLASFLLAGIAGGIFLIPIISTIQLRPAAGQKGKILAISNFSSFTGILASGVVFGLCGSVLPSHLLLGGAVAALLFARWLHTKTKAPQPQSQTSTQPTGPQPDYSLARAVRSVLGTCLQGLLSLRYKVTVSGLETIAGNGSILFLPNHPALIDPILVYALTAGKRPRPLADAHQFDSPAGRLVARALHPVLLPDAKRDGRGAKEKIQAGIDAIIAGLREGDSVLMYPSGQLYRSAKESLGGNSGVATILHTLPEQRVVLVRTTGLWGSSFGYAGPENSGKAPSLGKALLRGAKALLANFVLFTPRRPVHVEFYEPQDLPRTADKATLNRYLEAFYENASRPAVTYPRFFWQGSAPIALPEPGTGGSVMGATAIPAELREKVYALLRQQAGLEEGHVLEDSQRLGADLGLDSLAMMEFALALEGLEGKTITWLEGLITVGDCVQAAQFGLQEAEAEGPLTPALQKAWDAFVDASRPLAVPEGANTIAHAFVHNVRRTPKAALMADRKTLRTHRQVLMGAMALAESFRRIPGQRVGLMLPAVPAVLPVWLALQLAGKTPVMLNWTVGQSNLAHCCQVAGIEHAISATQFTARLHSQGLALESLPVQWILLEDVARTLGWKDKLRAAFKAYTTKTLPQGSIPDIAAVLFTSGSESLPKAVPLSHTNLLTNARDLIGVLKVKADDSVLAMLPPFHSFGLMVNIVLPLALGLRAAFYPNPTEAGPLLGMLRDFGLSLVASPPTFLSAILDMADKTEQAQQAEQAESAGPASLHGNTKQPAPHALGKLRYAFVGAEKCPERVYAAFARLCPHASLCEGYGITECSPVVSVNVPGQVVPGSIGLLLPSVQAALVQEDNGNITGPVQPGETGMLLVRGPSIFGGYLGAAPNPFVEYEGKSWYRTGDLVSMDAHNILFFRGRLKRFVKVGGEMISLPQMETVLLEAFSHREDAPQEGPALAVEAGAEELGSEIVLFTPMPITVQEANAALRRSGLSGLYAVKRVVQVASIPLLGTGKTNYRELKALLAGGTAS